MKDIFNSVFNRFIAEKNVLILWFPVFFGIGIAAYFTLHSEPNLIYSLFVLSAFLIATILCKRNRFLFWLMVILATAAAGFVAGVVRTKLVDAPMLEQRIGVTRMSGKVVEVSIYKNNKRFILTDIVIDKLKPEKTPKFVRVNINTDSAHAKAGDEVSFLVSLAPPPAPAVPGGYDFARNSYFERIGAVGYCLSDVDIIRPDNGFSIANGISVLRQKITENILNSLDETEGNIAAALLTGESGGIKKSVLEDIRIAGTAHILSISGLHLSLVAAIFFFFSRGIMALIPRLVLNYNIKKWSALIAILGSFFYLLISGSPIPAKRAFVMTSLVLTAIIIDRNGAPMRSIALAAMVIMLFMPESILTPSFQMSFAAVIALIAAFEALRPVFKEFSEYGIIRRFLIYLVSVIISSVVAGLATAPFAVYHFNNMPSYGVLANLIAVPLSTFWIMPFGVLALLLMPFGLEQLGLIPMGWGIDIMVKTAEYIASLPSSIHILPAIPNFAFGLLTIGGLWLCIWQGKWRLYGVVPVLIAIIITSFMPLPDILIGGEGEVFAVKDDNGKWIFSSKRKGSYTREMWLNRIGEEDFSVIDKEDSKNIKCDETGCIYNKNKYKVVIAKHPLSLQQDCESADILINLTKINTDCESAKLVITYRDIMKNGAYAISLGNQEVIFRNVIGERGKRPWS